MNRRQRDARNDPKARTEAVVDLGMSLSVYGKDGDGRLVEIKAPPAWYGFSPGETWPTEH